MSQHVFCLACCFIILIGAVATSDIVRPLQDAPSEPWAEHLGHEGREAHAIITAWLKAYYEHVDKRDDVFPPPPSLPTIKPRGEQLPHHPVVEYSESETDPHSWSRWNANQSCESFLEEKKERWTAKRQDNRAKRYLIVIPVGDDFKAEDWVTHPEHATYDLVAIYYGKNPQWTCGPLCVQSLSFPGTKWYLLNMLIKERPDLWASFQYQAVMVADDDIKVDTCRLNRAFEVFEAYGLLLGQMSLCYTPWRSTYWHVSESRLDSSQSCISLFEVQSATTLQVNVAMVSCNEAFSIIMLSAVSSSKERSGVYSALHHFRRDHGGWIYYEIYCTVCSGFCECPGRSRIPSSRDHSDFFPWYVYIGYHHNFYSLLQAPIFRMDFFQGVVAPTLYNAYTGRSRAIRSDDVVINGCRCSPWVSFES